MVRVAPVAEVEGGEIVDIEDGTYVVEVMSIVDDGVSDLYPDSGARFKWTFKIVKVIDGDEDLVGVELPWQWTGQRLTISKSYGASKFYAWTQALFGGEIPDDFEDTDDLIGKRATASVATPAGKTRAKIEGMRALKKRPAKQVEPEDDELF
mgnify:FL=1